ncbi:hypothetical protein BJV82DRAFT_610584 [Fennellomyces sp. T-0311]|nr:hypothetical protein BJV82DRAFT_610584 [Fennellomyces sp. T-0311]
MQQSISDDDHDSDSSDISSSISVASAYLSTDGAIVSSENREPAIHFAFPQRPPIRTASSRDHWQPEEEVTLWEHIARIITAYYTSFTLWIQETKSRLQNERQFTLRSRSVAEAPFCIASFGSIYGTFILIRAAAVNGWVVDHRHWDGTGHRFDKNPVITMNVLETLFVYTSIVCGIAIWVLLIARTRMNVYFASRWCLWFAYTQGALSLLSVHMFAKRSSEAMHDPYYAYSRGFWSCLCAGILNVVAALGFTVDWLLSFPFSNLSLILKGLVLPTIMVCSMVMIGALAYMSLEDWTYSEALIFCWTAVATIGYGDITPSRPEGKIFFLFYTSFGISIVGYMLLSIRAVITGTSSDIMKVNLMRVESLHDYSRHQRQKWLNRHSEPLSRRMSTTSYSPDTPVTPSNDKDMLPSQLRRRTTVSGPARPRSLSNVSTFSNYTIAGILNNKDRQILVQVITKSGAVRMGIILAICWLGGAGIFCLLENDWTYLDGLYFAFATQLTIGFGDIVPQTALAQEFWLVYIVISIAVAAYFISLCGDTLIEKLQIRDDNEDPESLFYTDEVAGRPDGDGDFSGYTALGRSLAADEEEDDQSVMKNVRSSSPISIDGFLLGEHKEEDHPEIAAGEEETPLIRHSSLPLVSATKYTTSLRRHLPQRGSIRRPHALKISPQYTPPEYHGRTSALNTLAHGGSPSQGRYGSLVTSESVLSSRDMRGSTNRPKHPCSPLGATEEQLSGYIDATKVPSSTLFHYIVRTKTTLHRHLPRLMQISRQVQIRDTSSVTHQRKHQKPQYQEIPIDERQQDTKRHQNTSLLLLPIKNASPAAGS